MSEDFIQTVLKSTIGSACQLIESHFVAGGCINNTLKLVTTQGPFFLKWKQEEPELFVKEARGLEVLKKLSPINVPQVLACGRESNKDYLLLEFIEKGPLSSTFWADFGKNLAEQHKQTHEYFGLDHDNHIGRLPQSNSARRNWVDFFIHERLEPQLKLAEQKQLAGSELRDGFENLYLRLPELLPEEPPSLLHGDLWSGNFMINLDSHACFFDPAVYYGHREMEISFTRMFGGFDELFYQAYNEVWPLEKGIEDRIDIHNLYPLLVHLNLFGRGYLPGILNTLQRFQ